MQHFIVRVDYTELCKNANKNLKLIFLPPYSPNLNHRKVLATLKKNLKKITKNNKSLEEFIELFKKFDYYIHKYSYDIILYNGKNKYYNIIIYKVLIF